MDEPVKQEVVVPPDVFVVIACGECDRDTRHKVLAEVRGHWQDDRQVVDLWRQYQIVQCQGCLTISFCEASQFSEDFDHDPDTGETYLPTTTRLFPSRIAGRPMMNEAQELPHNVYVVYAETHSALCAELRVMTGLGIRAIAEAVCRDKEMSGRNLEEKIDALATAGHITTAGARILHSLRFMGNAAAHEMRAHSPKELNAAFDVVEYMLHGVYILPAHAAHLPKQDD
jgi:hypothetical protein